MKDSKGRLYDGWAAEWTGPDGKPSLLADTFEGTRHQVIWWLDKTFRPQGGYRIVKVKLVKVGK